MKKDNECYKTFLFKKLKRHQWQEVIAMEIIISHFHSSIVDMHPIDEKCPISTSAHYLDKHGSG